MTDRARTNERLTERTNARAMNDPPLVVSSSRRDVDDDDDHH